MSHPRSGSTWLGKTLGDYPFRTYTVGQMGVPKLRSDNYAQEYPTSYFIPTSWLSYGTNPPSWTWYTPVHEVSHQWFYSIVGDDQWSEPWLDESFAEFSAARLPAREVPNRLRDCRLPDRSKVPLDANMATVTRARGPLA